MGKLGREVAVLDKGQANSCVCLPYSMFCARVGGKVQQRKRHMLGSHILPPRTLNPKAIWSFGNVWVPPGERFSLYIQKQSEGVSMEMVKI